MSLFADYTPNGHGAPLPDLDISRAETRDLEGIIQMTAQRQSVAPEEIAARLEREIALDDPKHLLLAARVPTATIAFARINYAERPAECAPNHQPAGFYLGGVIVDENFRRRGVGKRLTEARLDWLMPRAREVFYIAGDNNHASIDMHAALGFEELTRDFFAPRVTFQSGGGILFRMDLRRWKPE
ncbi:MAG: GNAT superfamily N-acetyltransferase [Planctomycetota bacterium]|jgi:GNAT superfamily N-acetyltransferase